MYMALLIKNNKRHQANLSFLFFYFCRKRRIPVTKPTDTSNGVKFKIIVFVILIEHTRWEAVTSYVYAHHIPCWAANNFEVSNFSFEFLISLRFTNKIAIHLPLLVS